MVYFQLTVYFLVIIWIQDSVEQNAFSISAKPNTTVSPGEEYEITCSRRHYNHFLLKRNNDRIASVSYNECRIHTSNPTDYNCVLTKDADGYVLVAKLKVLGGESSPQTVQWSCASPINTAVSSRVLNMTVRNPDPPTTTKQKPSSTLRDKTPSPTQSSRQTYKTPSPTQSSRQTIPVRATSYLSSSTSTDPQTTDKSPSSRAPPDQPPVSSTNNVDKQSNNFTINLIAICVIGVLVLVIITLVLIVLIVLMFLYNKRKQDHTKQGSCGPLALEPRGIPAEGNYDNLDRTMDDGHTYDTAQAQVVPEKSNLASNGYLIQS